MYRNLVLVLGAYCLLITAAHGMECQFENSLNSLDQLLKKCPRFYETNTTSYCCEDYETKSKFCCDEKEYNKRMPAGTSPAIIATAVLVPVVVLAGIGVAAWYFKLFPSVIYKRTSGSEFGH